MVNNLEAKYVQEEYPVKLFFHKYSKITDLALILLIGLGLSLILNRQKKIIKWIPIKNSFNKVNVVVGAVFLFFGLMGNRVLREVASTSLNSYQYEFKPFKNQNISLSYEGALPILSINGEGNFEEEGFIQGYYLEKQITILRECSFIPKVEDKYSMIIEKCKKLIPKNYLEEMKGIVNGYNLKRKEKTQFYTRFNPLTLNELVLFHLLPELEQFNLDNNPPLYHSSIACTVILLNDPELGPIMARNLDWCTKGVMGSCTLLVRRKSTNGTTLNLTLPGMVGVPTGMNDRGLCVAINTCEGVIDSGSFTGLPSLFFNRRCLESKSSIEEVKELALSERPLGPYHLSMADSETAAVLHFYQDDDKDYWRGLEDAAIVTTNCRYGPNKIDSTSKDSKLRRTAVENFLIENKTKKTFKCAKDALSLPRVNNIKTAHQLIMLPKSRSVKLKFDNGWAANSSSVKLNSEFFNQGSEK